MKTISRYIMTLALLLTAVGGAWADETLLLTIESKDYTTFLSGSKTFDDKVTVKFSNFVYYDGEEGWYADGDPSQLTVAGTNGYTITSCKFYTANGEAETGYTIEGKSPSVYLSASTEVYTDANQSVYLGYQGITKIEVYGTAPSAASADEVAWDMAKNTGSFTMPGGNVTLEPEYYPQATVAEGAVTAAGADARATTDDPLVKVDATKLTGAKKLMYFVSNSGTTAPAYDAEGWTDQLPTAEGITQQGIVYVWYYPVGTDEGDDGATATYSDGDICKQSITARIAAAPTYAVTFAEGTPETNEWKAEPNAGVTKGQTVTVTYTGTKKVIGVKVEKKAAAAAAKTLAEATSEDIGKIAGADGNIYDTKADAEAVATGNAVAMIAYVGTASDCAHGLAIALADESGTKEYEAAGTACSGKAAVTGGTWRLPSIKDWQYMFIGCGASGSYSDDPSPMSYSGLASKLTTAQGDALQNDAYWSSTEFDPGVDGWSLGFDGSSAAYFTNGPEDTAYLVRACLAF